MKVLPLWQDAIDAIVVQRDRFALAAAVSIGYAAQLLFQPDVFEVYALSAIAGEMASVFLESFLAGGSMILTVAWVERHAARRSGLYVLQLLAAVSAGSVLGVALWVVLAWRDVSSHALPFLCGEVLRLAVLGAFLALVHGMGQRLRAARAREREIAVQGAAVEAEAELSHLRLLEAQIEPHFLFNTIANVRRTWRVDPAFGHRMHGNVIRYLEASLPHMRSATSSLRQEVDLTRAYLELFSMRMGRRLRYSIECSEALGDHCFPRMALLTLVENAIQHGLMPSTDGGSVAVSAAVEEGDVVVRVVDDGVGLGGADTGGTGIGLVNVRARLAAQYGRRGRLEICSPPAGGVEALIRFPAATAGPSVAMKAAVA